MTNGWYFEREIPDFYPSPANGDMTEIAGTVTFAYADGKMTVSTSTFDLEHVNDDNKTKSVTGRPSPWEKWKSTWTRVIQLRLAAQPG